MILTQRPAPEDSLRGRALALLNELRGGRVTDDETLSPLLIADLIRSAWGALLDAELPARAQRGEGIDAFLLQRLPLTWTGTKPDRPAGTVRAWAAVPPLALLRGLPVVERVETADGEILSPASGLSDARLKVTPRPYARVRPLPAWWVDGLGLNVLLPPRMALLGGVTAWALPRRPDLGPDGQPFDDFTPCPVLSGKRWDDVRNYVLERHGPILVPGLTLTDRKNDGTTAAPNSAQP